MSHFFQEDLLVPELRVEASPVVHQLHVPHPGLEASKGQGGQIAAEGLDFHHDYLKNQLCYVCFDDFIVNTERTKH